MLKTINVTHRCDPLENGKPIMEPSNPRQQKSLFFCLIAPINRELPLESHPIVGLHVVIRHYSNLLLRRTRHHPQPSANQTPPPAATRPNPGRPQPRHGADLRRHFHRHSPLRGGGDPRHALVLAADEDDDAVSVAPVLPAGHAPQRARVLLVLHFLPLAFPPPVPHILRYPPSTETHFLSSLQPLDPNLHELPLARVFAIVSSSRDSADDFAVLRGLRVPFLDRDWAAQRVLPIRRQLPGHFAWLQLGLPFWGFTLALPERRV
uniref:Uncharacterized protein n=1 Tax=Quercus lobata TaxID=97700 RepID=A0A7N2KSD7_QUELO